MIKKIAKPKNIKFHTFTNDRFYYNDLIDKFFVKNTAEISFFNKEGNLHNEDGPATIFYTSTYKFYYLNNNNISKEKFTKETRHLICEWCDDFCKQQCFSEGK